MVFVSTVAKLNRPMTKRSYNMPKCTCDGRNPDCYMCGGWGWIGDAIQKRRTGWHPNKARKSGKNAGHAVARMARKRVGLAAQKPVQTTPCPYCGKFLRKRDIDFHVSRIHRDKWEDYLARISPRNPLHQKGSYYYERCNICGKFVINLKKHHEKLHFDATVDTTND